MSSLSQTTVAIALGEQRIALSTSERTAEEVAVHRSRIRVESASDMEKKGISLIALGSVSAKPKSTS